MNPYLSAALQPQIQAAQLAAEKQRLADAGRLTQSGAYGGSRQAIMEAAGNRDLMQNMSNINATGYANAYDKAMAQFNAEQGQQQTAQDAANLYGLSALQKQADMGTTQRGSSKRVLLLTGCSLKKSGTSPISRCSICSRCYRVYRLQLRATATRNLASFRISCRVLEGLWTF